MLKLLNQNKKLIANINNYSDLCIESELITFDSTLSFKYPLNALFKNDIKEEGYIRTKLNEYVIKEVNTRNNKLEVYCSLNFEDLEGKFFEHFNTVTTTIEDCLNLAFAGTGWVVVSSNILRKRTIKLTNVTSFKILKEAKKVFRAEFKVDTLNKKIFIFEKIGEDKGTYFAESLNLKDIEIQSNSYDFITRLIVEGKDGLTIESINNNKKYIENFQYSNKIKTYFWKDERYTSKESLKEDGEYKLNELSKPAKSYNLEILDLAKINKYYKNILDYKLGDTITLLSKKHKLKEKQRIVKIIEYPHDPYKNTCELANTILSFEDLQQDLQDAADTIDNITTDNGTIDGSTVDEIEKEQIKNFDIEVGKVVNLDVVNAKIENLIVNKADINQLNAVSANIGRLEATKADITELNAINAKIENLVVSKADIVDLNATNAKISVLEVETAKIGVLEGDVANIQDIVNGNLSSENIQTGGITGDRLNMNTVFVNDANIVNVNANKVNAGEIDTNKVKIKSADGGIEIVGPTQQWKDKNNKVRMQAGKDAQGNFTFGIFDETGTGTLIDHTGIKEKALGSNIIKENMIAPDAVGEKALDYNSFASGFNKDTNTSTLKATKVRLDNQNQTLDVAFTSLKSQSDANKTKTESNTTQINVANGKIETAIANTKIVKDGQEVLLKDDYNTTVATVNSMKNTISSHTTKIDSNTGKITGVESKTNVLERDLNSMSSKLSSTETTVKNHTTQISNVQNTANNANSKIDNLEIGGRNIFKNSKQILLNGSDNGNNNCSLIENEYVKISPKNNGNVYNTNIETYHKKEKGKTYTISFDILTPTSIGFYWYPSENYTKNNYINPSDKWQRIGFTYTQTGSDKVNGTLFGFNGLIAGQHYFYKNLKLELGNKATDFTEAPEDTQQQIDKNKNDIITVNTEVTTTKNKVSGIEQKLDSITTRVGSVESTTTTHTATINSHTSSINAVDGKINTAKTDAINTSKADAQNKANKALTDAKSYTGTEITKVNSTMTSKFAEIKTTTDSITQSVSNTNKEVSTIKVNVTNAENIANTANSKIDGLELGGRNLLPKNSLGLSNSATGTFDSSTNTWSLTASPSSSSWGRGLYIKTPHNIIIPYGKCAIYSFEIKVSKQITWNTDVNNAPVSGSAWSSNDNDDTTLRKTSSKTITKVNEWVKCWSYISNTSSKNTAKIDIKDSSSTFGIVTTNESSNVNFQIRNFKVELGNKATDWTQAPEDVSKEILDITTEKVNAAKAEIKVTTDSITNRVSNTEKTTTTLTTSVNKAQTDATKGINDAKTANDKAIASQNSANLAQEIAKAMSSGKLLYTDPMFKKGTNNCSTYNNSGGSTVEVLRVTKPSDCPTKSTHCLEIRTKGSPTSPGWGGFIAPINSRANAKFIIRLIAKIPSGRTLTLASNSLGTNSSDKLLTSNAGTGIYTEYIREVKCGSTGSFSSGGHFYLTGGSTPTSSSPLIWNVALCEVYDVTDCDYTLQDTVSEVTTVKNKTATLETNVNSITGRVSSVESTTSSLNGKVTAHESRLASAEQKITPNAITSTVTSSSIYKNDLNGKVSTNNIISTINQSAEAVSINANKINLTGNVQVRGRFETIEALGKLIVEGNSMRGYISGNNYPIYSAGVWAPEGEKMGYVSVGRTNAEVTDTNGCFYMSAVPKKIADAYELTMSTLYNGELKTSGLRMHRNGRNYYRAFMPSRMEKGVYAHEFNGGLSCYSLTCNEIFMTGQMYTDNQNMQLWAGGWNNNYYMIIQSNGYITSNGRMGLGTPERPFHQLVSVMSPNITSDRREKQEIKYLNDGYRSNEELTHEDMYNFIKNDLQLATYKMTENIEKGLDRCEIGFIAQDIADNKVGKYIVDSSDKDHLSYNMGNRISVLEGALQEAIKQIEILKEKINS